MNVYDFAIDIEERNMRLFAELATEAPHNGVDAIYRRMVEDERRLRNHFRRLRRLDRGPVESQLVEGLAGRVNRLYASLAAMPRAENDLAAYRRLLQVQKEVCRLFNDAAAAELDPLARGELEFIAGEERIVFDRLQRLYDFVDAPEKYLAWGEFSNLEEFRNFGRTEN